MGGGNRYVHGWTGHCLGQQPGGTATGLYWPGQCPPDEACAAADVHLYGSCDAGIRQGGVMAMRLLRFLVALWHGWHALWQLNWDRTAALDFHKWESKIEIRQRLSGRHL